MLGAHPTLSEGRKSTAVMVEKVAPGQMGDHCLVGESHLQLGSTGFELPRLGRNFRQGDVVMTGQDLPGSSRVRLVAQACIQWMHDVRL